jgi:hypothetical protein
VRAIGSYSAWPVNESAGRAVTRRLFWGNRCRREILGKRGRAGTGHRGVDGSEEIGLGIDTHEAGGLTQGVENGGDLCSPQGARPIVILAADHRATEHAFSGVIIERDQRILDEAGEACAATIKSAA